MNTPKPTTIIVDSAYQTIEIGKRCYWYTRITAASYKRLMKLIDSIPQANRRVDFDAKLSPIVYLEWKRAINTPHLPGGDQGMFPAAHPHPLTITPKQAARNKRLAELDAARCALVGKLMATPRAVSSITDQERAEAKALGMGLPDVPTFGKAARK